MWRLDIAHGDRTRIQARDGVREARWGQLAPWQGHGGKRRPPIHELDAGAVKSKAKRCLVIADGFYVTRMFGAKKHSLWIHADQPVCLAGVLATHPDDGIESFAIVTVPAFGIVAPVAERMPAVVDERWLAGGEPILVPLDGWRVDAEGRHDPNQGELF